MFTFLLKIITLHLQLPQSWSNRRMPFCMHVHVSITCFCGIVCAVFSSSLNKTGYHRTPGYRGERRAALTAYVPGWCERGDRACWKHERCGSLTGRLNFHLEGVCGWAAKNMLQAAWSTWLKLKSSQKVQRQVQASWIQPIWDCWN